MEDGRVSLWEDDDKPCDLFGAHPIQGDGWYLRSLDLSKGPHVKIFDPFLMTSLDHRGVTGPSLVWGVPGMRAEFIGETRVTVEAGTFDALHFCYGERGSKKQGANEAGKHPPYEVWVTAGGDYIVLQAEVGGYMMMRYELTELERIPGDRES